jgi:hypothetical protein
MAAAPKYGTIYARGLKTGTPFAVDIYGTDVVGDLVNFDGGAGAGAASPTFYTFPEDVIVYDAALDAGAATYQITNIRLIGNGVPSGVVIRWKTHLNTLNNRPPLAVKVAAGHRLSAIQNA